MTNFHASTEYFKIEWADYEGPVIEYLDILLGKPHANLKKIHISDEELFGFIRPESLQQPKIPEVNQLIFEKTAINEPTALRQLSTNFPALDYLKLMIAYSTTFA